MVQITERATAELRRLLTNNFARPQQGVRLRLNEAGDLVMTIDVPHSGDSVIRRDNVPVLIVDGRLATRLARRLLDYPAASGNGFTLSWRPPQANSVANETC
jgi:Fe-S cluster assembly iron-binding protein IscA